MRIEILIPGVYKIIDFLSDEELFYLDNFIQNVDCEFKSHPIDFQYNIAVYSNRINSIYAHNIGNAFKKTMGNISKFFERFYQDTLIFNDNGALMKFGTGGFIASHVDLRSCVQGVFYLTSSLGEEGGLLEIYSSLGIDKKVLATVCPQRNTAIMFRGDTPHSVTPYFGVVPRISFSFGLTQKKHRERNKSQFYGQVHSRLNIYPDKDSLSNKNTIVGFSFTENLFLSLDTISLYPACVSKEFYSIKEEYLFLQKELGKEIYFGTLYRNLRKLLPFYNIYIPESILSVFDNFCTEDTELVHSFHKERGEFSLYFMKFSRLYIEDIMKFLNIESKGFLGLLNFIDLYFTSIKELFHLKLEVKGTALLFSVVCNLDSRGGFYIQVVDFILAYSKYSGNIFTFDESILSKFSEATKIIEFSYSFDSENIQNIYFFRDFPQ